MGKPSGLTAIPGRELHRYLAKLPVEKVWGIPKDPLKGEVKGPTPQCYYKSMPVSTG